MSKSCHIIESPTSFNIHPLGFLLVADILEDFRAGVGFGSSFAGHAHLRSNFSAFENLGSLYLHEAALARIHFME